MSLSQGKEKQAAFCFDRDLFRVLELRRLCLAFALIFAAWHRLSQGEAAGVDFGGNAVDSSGKSRAKKKKLVCRRRWPLHARCSRCFCLSQFSLFLSALPLPTRGCSPLNSRHFARRSLLSQHQPTTKTGHPRPRLGRRRPARRARRSQVCVCHRRRVAPEVGRCLFPQVFARLGPRRRPRQGEEGYT